MKCFLKQEVAQKMHYYVKLSGSEVSGIAKSEIINGDVYITDIKIMKQICDGASTEIDEEDERLVSFEMKKAGEDLSKWNVWWHSHHTMGVFWSSTDTGTIKKHANNGGYMISIVTNLKGEYKTRIDSFPKDMSPFNKPSHFLVEDDIETTVLSYQENPERRTELELLIKEASDECDEMIKEIEEEKKIDIEMINQEVAEKISEIEKQYLASFGELENELSLLSEDYIIEDSVLEEEIKNEVSEKVSSKKTYVNKYENDYNTKDYNYESIVSKYNTDDDNDKEMQEIMKMTDDEFGEYMYYQYKKESEDFNKLKKSNLYSHADEYDFNK